MSINLNERWVKVVLDDETNPFRFEQFAAALTSELTNQVFVPTSHNYDQGYDAKRVDMHSASDYVCATLMADENKPLKDIDKLISNKITIKTLYLCFSKALTEYRQRNIKQRVQLLIPDASIYTMDGSQLASTVAYGYGDKAFLKHYGGEYDNIKTHLLSMTSRSDRGMSLALATLTTEDSVELRKSLGQQLVLALVSEKPATLLDMHNRARAEFPAMALTEAALLHYCNDALKNQLLQISDEHYYPTALGIERMANNEEEHIREIIHGEKVLKDAVEGALGFALSNDQWKRIWRCIREGLTSLFYTQGEELLHLTYSLANDNSHTAASEAGWAQLEKLIQHAIAQENSNIQDQLHESLLYAFSPNNRSVAMWLKQLGGAYVSLCVLGAEHSISSALDTFITKNEFYFDTDVVLSSLCEHENGHTAAIQLKNAKENRGGRIGVLIPVAEECARHAARAESDRNHAISPNAKPLQFWEIEKYLDTVFAREFEKLRLAGKVSCANWHTWISTFAGSPSYSSGQIQPDNQNMIMLLRSLNYNVVASFSVEQQKRSESLRAGYVGPKKDNITDEQYKKLRIDSEILVLLSDLNSAACDGALHYYFISSGRNIPKLAEYSRDHLLLPPTILRPSELMWILSLMPEHPVTLESLGGFLFEGKHGGALRGAERRFMQIIGQIQSTRAIPLATRGVLVNKFHNNLVKQAKKDNLSRESYSAKIENDPAMIAHIGASLLDADVVRTPIEVRNAREAVDEAIKRLDKERM